MTPKSLLRHPMAISRRADFLKGGFNPILEDHCKNPERIVICSGKVYYDLKKRALEENRLDKILFVRLEQIYPLDIAYFQNLQNRFPGVSWIWCQEEPKNMGAWAYLKLRFLEAQLDISYAGRPASASPATGSPLQHQRELEAFLKDALGY